jgi:Zn-dependent peptidase ImmA (M78 family)
VEIGAEIFAAELIYPEGEFRSHLEQMGIGTDGCTAEVLVRLTQRKYANAVWLACKDCRTSGKRQRAAIL